MQKIDVKKLTDISNPIDRANEMERFKNALVGDSFCLLINHNIPEEVIDQAYSQSKLFHDMDDSDERKQATHYRHAHFGRGWSPCGEEPAYSPGTKATCSAFDMCYEVEEVDEEFENYGPNLWPPKMPEFQKAVYDYYQNFSVLEKVIGSTIEEILGIEKGFITARMTEKSPSTMRLIFYPEIKEEPEENLFGISAHTDYEVFTLLTQSEKGSELKNPEGKWTHVDSDRYEIILMMGDMTEVMTNGLIKATPHRVPPTKWERYSITRFCAIDGHHIVEPLEQFIEPGVGPKYDPISQQKNIKDGLAEAAANTKAMESS